MNKIILTDVDGVLLDWMSAFDEHMLTLGFVTDPEFKDDYRLSLRYGTSMEHIDALVREFNSSDAMLSLAPLPYAVEYVQALHEKGYTFIAITAMSSCATAKEKRIKNLDQVFGQGVFDHSQMQCLNPHDSKYFFLKKWQDTGLFWVDDHFMHAEAGHELGLSTLLMTAPYNVKYTTSLFPRVDSWKDVYEIVMSK